MILIGQLSLLTELEFMWLTKFGRNLSLLSQRALRWKDNRRPATMSAYKSAPKASGVEDMVLLSKITDVGAHPQPHQS
jgi:hypothetical protein